MPGLSEVVRIGGMFIHDPRDAIDRVRDRFGQRGVNTIPADPDWPSAVAGLIGGNVEYDTAQIWDAIRPIGDFFSDADPAFANVLYGIVRAQEPERVVETGVARGISTRFMLEALEANGHGHLWSIDRVSQREDAKAQSAAAVVDRSHWTFKEGTSRRLLPALLDELGGIDMFVHDSAHTEWNMLFEFRSAWRHLRPGGLIVSDDVTQNAAFEKFIAEIGADFVVGRQNRGGGFGVVRR